MDFSEKRSKHSKNALHKWVSMAVANGYEWVKRVQLSHRVQALIRWPSRAFQINRQINEVCKGN